MLWFFFYLLPTGLDCCRSHATNNLGKYECGIQENYLILCIQILNFLLSCDYCLKVNGKTFHFCSVCIFNWMVSSEFVLNTMKLHSEQNWCRVSICIYNEFVCQSLIHNLIKDGQKNHFVIYTQMHYRIPFLLFLNKYTKYLCYFYHLCS